MTPGDKTTVEGDFLPRTSAQERLVQLGWIRRAHGIRGLVVIRRMNPDTEAFVKGARLFLQKGEEDGAWHSVRSIGGSGEDLRVGFKGVQDRSAAEALRGHGVFVHRSTLAEGDPDEFYFFELVGLSAVSAEGKLLGKVNGVIESPAHEILEVQGDVGELLVPFVDAYVGEIDLDAGQVVLHNTDDLILED